MSQQQRGQRGRVTKTYGMEYCVLPLVSLSYLYWMTDFTMCGVLFNNAIITAACAGGAMWRSSYLAKVIGPRNARDRLDPMWPFMVSLMLLFLAGLQLILSVAHLSYFRKGPLARDFFDN